MQNLLSFDLESWVYPESPEFISLTSKERETLDAGYLNHSIYELLKLLEDSKNKATFFVVSQQLEWKNSLIFEIRKAGHEIAFHTYDHTILKSDIILIDQIKKSKEFINEFKPTGFRGPQLQYNSSFDRILKKEGFEYKSNYFNQNNFNYNNDLTEIYISSCPFFKNNGTSLPKESGISLKNIFKNIYYGSPFYFPIVPNDFIFKYIERCNSSGVFFNIFFHNWQIIKPKNNINMKLLLKNPLYFNYTLDINNKFKSFIKIYNSILMSDKVLSKSIN